MSTSRPLPEHELRKLVAQALSQARVSELIVCNVLYRAIVLVPSEDISIAQDRIRQLDSHQHGWEIRILTCDQLVHEIDRAFLQLTSLDHMTDHAAECAIGEGVLSYSDLARISPNTLIEMSKGPSRETSEQIASLMPLATSVADAFEYQEFLTQPKELTAEQAKLIIGEATRRSADGKNE